MSAVPGSSELTADIALAARGSGKLDIGHRADADVLFAPGDELPFVDRAVGAIALGDAVASWSLRDHVDLLLECRRVLAPGAPLRLVEGDAAATSRVLAPVAALVGLCNPLANGHGWRKHAAGASCATPLVSILVPAWNPRFFAACLDSAIAQTYRPLEIVVCDDSADERIATLTAARADAADIRYSRNPTRLQQRGNYARCLALARGEFVKFLNDDDVLDPACVAMLVQAFVDVPDLALATSHRQVIDAQSRAMDDMPATRPVVAADLIIDGPDLANAMIMHGLNFIGEPSTPLFRKRDLMAAAGDTADGPFHFNGKEIRGIIDFSMWARLLLRGNAAFLSARLSAFRRHGEQAQAQAEVVARNVAGIRELQREWITLGLFRHTPPHLVRAQPLVAAAAHADAWALTQLRPFARSQGSDEEALAQWRAIERHAFDFAWSPRAGPGASGSALNR